MPTHPLFDVSWIEEPAEAYLPSIGDIFVRFGVPTQDSGNVSYGVRVGDRRFFVKTAGDPVDPAPYLPHDERVALLRNAARLARRVAHPSLPTLEHVLESPCGPLLVYRWVDGDLLHSADVRRRFRDLPTAPILAALQAVYDVHARLVADGWIAVDFYDGSLIYDFAASQIHVVDVDHYQQGPFVNEMGRMFGSERFMAPEEFTRGARIDERTTVFGMGRTALILLGEGTLDAAAFRGPAGLFAVAARACQPAPTDRFTTMGDFVTAWRAATN